MANLFFNFFRFSGHDMLRINRICDNWTGGYTVKNICAKHCRFKTWHLI